MIKKGQTTYLKYVLKRKLQRQLFINKLTQSTKKTTLIKLPYALTGPNYTLNY